MPDRPTYGRHGIPILSVCQDVHMVAMGSYACPNTELSDAVQSLQHALTNWIPPNSDTKEFDSTVRQLIEIAIQEGQTVLNRLNAPSA